MNDQTSESRSTANTLGRTHTSFQLKPMYLLFAVTFLVSLSVMAVTGLPNRSAFRQSTADETIPPAFQSSVPGADASVYPIEDLIVSYEAGLADYNVPFGIGTVADTSSIRSP